MLELFEKTLLAGIGTLSLTQKKAEELIDELKERMNLSEDEGKKLIDKLIDAAKKNQQTVENAAHNEIQKACERLGVASAEELDEVKNKITELENQIKAMQTG
jgi:poly(hydroxyalkanoate) granule-associated protein